MQYKVKALNNHQQVVWIDIDAPDESSVRQQLHSRGLGLLAIKSPAVLSFKSREQFPLSLFSQELLALLNAGLSIVEAIETLGQKESRAYAKKILDRMIALLYQGLTFSAAMQQLPQAFPPLYIATVSASEKSGDLSEALTRYVAYHNQIDIIRKKVLSASIYPLLLLAVGGLVTLFLMGYVVPKFSVVYENAGTQLPWLSELLLQWGKFIGQHAGVVFGSLIALVVGLVYAASRDNVRSLLVAQLWRIPGLGERLHVFQLARFYRTTGMLLRGGIPAVSALNMVSGLLDPALVVRLKLATRQIGEGIPLSTAMEQNGLTTPVAARMLRVGERSGQMGDMMERISAFYDEEIARWVDWVTRLFEPLLMLFIGVVIGLIVILMYMPVFELAGSIQ